MSAPLEADDLADRLAEVYLAIGPLYRRVSRIVTSDEPAMGMSVGVRAVLDQLRLHGQLTVPQLARSQELSRQFVQRMVNEAHDAGFVEFIPNPAHRKSRRIQLTDRGRIAIHDVIDSEYRLMGQVGGDLTGEELDATLRVLHHMHHALGQLKSDDSSQ